MRDARQQEVAIEPALRDAEAIVGRAEEDERAARDARARYRDGGLPILEPDDHVAAALRAGESVVEMRQAVTVGRLAADADPETFAGRLYLTTARLILLGKAALNIELSEIEELALAGDRLLVRLNDGTGLDIDAGGPRLLRVQVAAARAAVRG